MGCPRGQIVDTSHSGGLNVRQLWTLLFSKNEEFWLKNQSKVLTDLEIAASMRAAFPDRHESKVLDDVVRVRSIYNRGIFTGWVVPSPMSCQYERKTDGTLERFVPFSVRNPKPLVRKIQMAKVRKVSKVLKVSKNKGKTLGLNVKGTWGRVFATNSRAKLTDEQISRFMNKEFPGRTSKEFSTVEGVGSVRRGYNKGYCTGGKAPSVQSVRYGEEGEVLTVRGKAAAPAKAKKVGVKKVAVKTTASGKKGKLAIG